MVLCVFFSHGFRFVRLAADFASPVAASLDPFGVKKEPRFCPGPGTHRPRSGPSSRQVPGTFERCPLLVLDPLLPRGVYLG